MEDIVELTVKATILVAEITGDTIEDGELILSYAKSFVIICTVLNMSPCTLQRFGVNMTHSFRKRHQAQKSSPISSMDVKM